jgi:hypothetical protein
MRQDLGNMVHMIKQVQSFEWKEDLTDADLYDVPRNIMSSSAAAERMDEMEENDKKDAENVYESILKPKTKALGGRSYFAVTTERANEGEK